MSRPDPQTLAQQVIQTGEIPESLQNPSWYHQWIQKSQAEDELSHALLDSSSASQTWFHQYVKALAKETIQSISHASPDKVPVSLYRFTSALHPLAPEYFSQGLLSLKEECQQKAPHLVMGGELKTEIQSMLSHNFETLDQHESILFAQLVEQEDSHASALKEELTSLESDITQNKMLLEVARTHLGEMQEVSSPVAISILGNLQENLKNRRESNASSPSSSKPKV